jgi:hypothetical protein
MRLDLSGSKKMDHEGFSVKIYGPEPDKSKRIVCGYMTPYACKSAHNHDDIAAKSSEGFGLVLFGEL